MIKALSILTLALLVSAPAAYAAPLEVGVNAEANAHANVNALANSNTDDEDATSSTSTPKMEKDKNATSSAQGNASTTANAHGQATAEAHRSAVATFVHSLLSIADRDGGIGAQVRLIAQSQNDSASTTAAAMAKVESRSKLATFFAGTDWKSVAELRSQIAKTDSDIAKLEVLLNQASSTEVRADLQAQIDVLKSDRAAMQAFVDAHANGFSLFGWFTKLFAK